jgi:hypothetical protein
MGLDEVDPVFKDNKTFCTFSSTSNAYLFDQAGRK